MLVEVRGGSAGLAAALESAGCTALGIDHQYNRHTPKAKVLELDVADKSGCASLMRLCRNPCFGVPCGTASRAREIKLKRGGPPPLSTEVQPWGRTDIKEQLQAGATARLETANGIYRAMLAAINILEERGVP